MKTDRMSPDLPSNEQQDVQLCIALIFLLVCGAVALLTTVTGSVFKSAVYVAAVTALLILSCVMSQSKNRIVCAVCASVMVLGGMLALTLAK